MAPEPSPISEKVPNLKLSMKNNSARPAGTHRDRSVSEVIALDFPSRSEPIFVKRSYGRGGRTGWRYSLTDWTRIMSARMTDITSWLAVKCGVDEPILMSLHLRCLRTIRGWLEQGRI